MRIRLAILTLVTLSSVGTHNAHGFDGKRQGFILGFGAGTGVTSFTQTLSGSTLPDRTTARENKYGIVTDFKVGGGVNEQFLLYFANRVSWFPMENGLGEDVIIASSVGQVGLSYYLRKAPPSLYVLGLAGLASWSAPFQVSDAHIGFGLGGGMGWEFSPHWSVEATLTWGIPSTEEAGLKAETNAFSVLVTINGLAY